MSAEDETYDIDLYGDEPEADDDQQDLYGVVNDQQPETKTNTQAKVPNEIQNTHTDRQGMPRAPSTQSLETPPVKQGVKRKAVDDEDESAQRDERPLDHGAQVSLKLTDMQWWTTEEDLRGFCASARCEDELVEVSFGEHKINGKSRGEAYLEFHTPQAAGMVKREIEKSNTELEAGSKSSIGIKSKISVWYTAPGNPFRLRDGQAKKEVGGKYAQQQGAYNSYSTNNRGNYTGRGRGGGGGGGGGYNRGGGQWSSQNSNNANNNNFNNGMMNGYGNMSFAGFPAMGMNQNAMMNSMMNMGAMGMMPGMMAGRGNMMNRGGWTQNSFPRGGYNAGWDNKKPRTE